MLLNSLLFVLALAVVLTCLYVHWATPPRIKDDGFSVSEEASALSEAQKSHARSMHGGG